MKNLPKELPISKLLLEVQIEAFFNDVQHFTWKKTRNDRLVLEGLSDSTFCPVKLGKWQLLLKMVAFYNQKGLCICGKPLNSASQLHHALVSRKEVMSMNPAEQAKIHHSLNVLELHPKCHQDITREASLSYLNKIYNNEAEEWLLTLKIGKLS